MSNKEGKFKYTPKYLLEKIEAEGDAKNTLIKSAAQVVVTSVIGSFAGSFCGNYSFPIGAILIGVGNYKDYSWMAPLGTGMMAAALARPKEEHEKTPPPQDQPGMSGFDLHTEANNAMERAKHWHDAFMSRTYLSKVFKKKASQSGNASTQRKVAAQEKPEEMNGLSDTPNSAQSLEEIEKQLIASAMEFQKKQQSQPVQGTDPDLEGLEEPDFSSM